MYLDGDLIDGDVIDGDVIPPKGIDSWNTVDVELADPFFRNVTAVTCRRWPLFPEDALDHAAMKDASKPTAVSLTGVHERVAAARVQGDADIEHQIAPSTIGRGEIVSLLGTDDLELVDAPIARG